MIEINSEESYEYYKGRRKLLIEILNGYVPDYNRRHNISQELYFITIALSVYIDNNIIPKFQI